MLPKKLQLLMLLTSPWLYPPGEEPANDDDPEPPDLDVPPDEPGPESDEKF
jgi:hypothetical protein